MLALYSDVGNKSNSHAKKCELGEELKKLDGKHELVIQGINDKIDSLISKGNGGGASISDADLVDLKAQIVAKVGEVASVRNASATPEPVTCNFDGVVWTPDALATLETTVRSVMASAPLKDTVTNGFSRQGQLLVDLKESLKSVSKQEGIDAISKNLGDRIQAISSKMDDWKGPQTSEGDDVEEVPELQKKDWLSVLEAQAESLTALAAEQGVLKQTLADGLREINRKLFEEGRGGGEGEVGGGEEEERPEVPGGYNEEIYISSNIDDVIQKFKEGDSSLYIALKGRHDTALELSTYRRGAGASSSEISYETLVELVNERKDAQIKCTPARRNAIQEKTIPYFEKKTDNFLPIERLRVMHSFFVDASRDNSKSANCAMS